MIFNSFYLCAWSVLWTAPHLETGFRCGMFSTAKRLGLTFSNPSLCSSVRDVSSMFRKTFLPSSGSSDGRVEVEAWLKVFGKRPITGNGKWVHLHTPWLFCNAFVKSFIRLRFPASKCKLNHANPYITWCKYIIFTHTYDPLCFQSYNTKSYLQWKSTMIWKNNVFLYTFNIFTSIKDFFHPISVAT